jgi:hypothetical protein
MMGFFPRERFLHRDVIFGGDARIISGCHARCTGNDHQRNPDDCLPPFIHGPHHSDLGKTA